MTWDPALEAVLPELREPGVPGVSVQTQLQEVVVEGGDPLGLQLGGDTTHGLLLIALRHFSSVGPTVTGGWTGGRGGRGWSGRVGGLVWSHVCSPTLDT